MDRGLRRLIAALGALWLAFAVQLGAAQLGAAQPAAGQGGGPVQLFPNLGTPPEQPQAPPGRVGPAITPPARPGAQTGTGPPEGFRVEGLAAPGIDAIGLAGPAEGGFEQDLWAGSDGELVLALLRNLPVAIENPPLRALTRRLLMTGGPLDGLAAPGSALAARAGRLLAMGDLEGAGALLERVPATASDSALARLVVEAALLAGDDDAACRRTADIAPGSSAPFWAKVAVYCRLVDGDQDGARLGLELLRDAGQTDDAAFFDLVETIAGGETAAPAQPGEPSALHVALLRLAGLPLPATALRSPELLAAAMRDPRLVAGDPLAVAERAFLFGALPVDGLAARYDEQAQGPTDDALRRIETEWSPRTRALAYDAVRERSDPVPRAELLDALWRAAQGPERFLVADVFAAPFAALPVERDLLRAAPSAARALLAAGRPVPAARWFSLLGAEARDARAREGSAQLVPLFALVGFGGSDAVPVLDQRAMAAWRQDTPDAQAKAGRLLALLDGIGTPVPATAWQELVMAAGLSPEPAPPVAYWRGLQNAAAAGRLGETVLFALHMLGGRPAAAHPEALAAALQALRSAGLNQEARSIAIATALAMGL